MCRGGQRQFAIPNVLYRLIQQAIQQALTPVFDPGFSDSSHGFRPNRSAHGATKQVQRTIRRGAASSWTWNCRSSLTGSSTMS